MTTNLPLPRWLLEWLGVDVESLEGGTASVSFVRFPEGELGLLALLGVALGIAIVVFTYLREGQLARWKKLSLAGLRGLLLIALALIIFYPVLEVDRARELRAVTPVLIDDSLSFSIKDRYQGAPEDADETAKFLGVQKASLENLSRAELVNKFLSDPKYAFLEKLARNNRLEIFTYSDDVRRLTTRGTEAKPNEPSATDGTINAAGGPPNPGRPGARTDDQVPSVRIEPRGTSTDLSSALRSAVEQQGGARIAGMVVIGDGRLTAGAGLSGVTTFLRERQIPVHAIGVGDPTPPRNLRVSTILASERIFAGDPVAIDVTVDQKGYDGETIQVELIDQFAQDGANFGEERVLDTKEITYEEARKEGVARFKVDLEDVGKHRLTARVAVRDEEAFPDDNEQTALVEMIEEASRVLMISGGPSWEYRFLQNLLRRDRRVTVSCWLQSADSDFPQEGNVRLEKLPIDPKDLFEYDVVILLDPDSRSLPGGWPALLERFVSEQSGGLVYVAGEKYTAGLFGSQEMKPITNMLPVVADLSRAESEAGGSFSVQEWPLVPTRLASSHSSTRLSSRPERNRERWEELPGIYWSFPIRKTKPGANVLLTHSGPARRTADGQEPILTWQYYSGGRAIFLGSDETWRWRSTTEEIYDQFWMQTVRYLTEGRLQGGKKRLLQLDQEKYELGDVVRVSALVQDDSFRPSEADHQVAVIETPDIEETELRLEKDPTAPGWFRGIFVPRKIGTYRVRLPDGSEALAQVRAPEIEFQEPHLDESSLRELAETTRGKYVRLWEAASIPDEIPDRRQTVVTTDEPIPLWDNWFSLSLLAGLLTIEWILRKLVRLL